MLELESSALDVLGELVDLVATWGEVEFGEGEPLIEPADWLGFVEQHEWHRPDRVLEIMLSLWSMTLPYAHATAPPDDLGAPRVMGSVSPIDQAPSARRATQPAYGRHRLARS